MDFCVFILYPAVLLNLMSSLTSFLVDSLGFLNTHTDRDSFISLSLIFFAGFIILPRTSSTD